MFSSFSLSLSLFFHHLFMRLELREMRLYKLINNKYYAQQHIPALYEKKRTGSNSPISSNLLGQRAIPTLLMVIQIQILQKRNVQYFTGKLTKFERFEKLSTELNLHQWTCRHLLNVYEEEQKLKERKKEGKSERERMLFELLRPITNFEWRLNVCFIIRDILENFSD